MWYAWRMQIRMRIIGFLIWSSALLWLACADRHSTDEVADNHITMDASLAERDGIVNDAKVDAFIPQYPLDDTLRMNHLQALGTHNSYHLQPDVDILPWRYNHLPLDEQLDLQGVRQFELDIYENESGEFEVYHLAFVDARTTCPNLLNCLQVLKGWSDVHLGHHPFLVLLEVKRFRGTPADTVRRLESMLATTWSRERLVTPSLIQREYSSIAEGLAEEGWPTLGDLRGRMMAVLHAGGELRQAYLDAPGGTAERFMFPDAYGNLDASYAAYHSMNNPITGQASIQEVVQAGHLVRTRADADGAESDALDYSRANAALSSGAHFISTDFPYRASETNYGFVIPGGTPSRCNPLTSPANCVSSALENPETLAP